MMIDRESKRRRGFFRHRRIWGEPRKGPLAAGLPEARQTLCHRPLEIGEPLIWMERQNDRRQRHQLRQESNAGS
jgi:hypothetical protein